MKIGKIIGLYVLPVVGVGLVAGALYLNAVRPASVPDRKATSPENIDDLVCGNALGETGVGCHAPETLPAQLDHITSHWESYGSALPEAKRFCSGDMLYFVSELSRAGAIVCIPQTTERWEMNPASLHFQGSAVMFKTDALGRPVYNGNVTPLDSNGQPSR